MFERSPQGAATLASRVEIAAQKIADYPRASRRDPETGSFEYVVKGLPILLIYELNSLHGDVGQADIIAVFHTARAPLTKPRSKR